MRDAILIELATTWELQAETGGDGLNKLQPPARETLRACADTLRMLVSTNTAPHPAYDQRPGVGTFALPAALHPETAKLVAGFASALAQKLRAAERKYGYSDGWTSPDWVDECREHLLEHVAKGDPRDVAAYCAFLWHHGASTASKRPKQPSDNEEATQPWYDLAWACGATHNSSFDGDELTALTFTPGEFEAFCTKLYTSPMGGAAEGWRPIETAPRGTGEDGPSDVRHPDYVQPPKLLLNTAEGVIVGYYDWYYHPGYGRGARFDESAWRDVAGGQAYEPTHWMPLPAAPQEGSQP